MGNHNTHGSIDEDELEEIHQSTHFHKKEIIEMHEKFQTDFPDGVITREGFTTMYRCMFPDGDATRFAQHVFRGYDVDCNGVIDFQEFMSTLSRTAKGSVDEKLKWVFDLYDIDNSGEVTRPEAVEMIMAIFRMQGVPDAKNKAEVAAIELFEFLDKNKTDSLSESEFVHAIRGCSAIQDVLKGSF